MATLVNIKTFIAKHNWTFAKTMPQFPHWYVVRKDCDEAEFVDLVVYIRAYGDVRPWGHYMLTYLDVDEYKYWTMGNPIDETTIINRAVI